MKIELFRKNTPVPDTIEKQIPKGDNYKLGSITFIETCIVFHTKSGIHIRPLFKKPKQGLILIEGAENVIIIGQGGGVKLYAKPLLSL